MKPKREIVWAAAVLALLMVNAATTAGFGVFYNTEDCLPRGWYVSTPIVGPLKAGQTVIVCPPLNNPAVQFAIARHWLTTQPRSFCPGRLTPYIKKVYGLPGDRVNITPAAVWVNGVEIPKTASMPTTLDGHTPMPHVLMGRFVVPKGQVFLLATHAANAFDGRYFGPVPRSDVRRLAFRLG